MINKKYFKYLYKNNIKPLVIVFILSILFFVLFDIVYIIPYLENTSNVTLNTVTFLSGLIVGCFYYVLILFLFSYNLQSPYYKKNSLDMYASLPVTKKESVFTRLLFVYSTISVVFIITFLLRIIILIGFNFHIKYEYLFFGIFIILVYGLLFTLIFHLVFLFANNNIDGFLMPYVSILTLIAILSVLGISLFIFLINANNQSYLHVALLNWMLSFSSINIMWVLSSLLSNSVNFDSHFGFELPSYQVLSIVITFAKIVGYFFFIKYLVNKQKYEKAESPSDSYFGYRVQLPILLCCLYGVITFSLVISLYDIGVNGISIYLYLFILYIALFIVGLGLHMLLERKFKISKKAWISIGLEVLIGVCYSLILAIIFINKFGTQGA